MTESPRRLPIRRGLALWMSALALALVAALIGRWQGSEIGRGRDRFDGASPPLRSPRVESLTAAGSESRPGEVRSPASYPAAKPTPVEDALTATPPSPGDDQPDPDRAAWESEVVSGLSEQQLRRIQQVLLGAAADTSVADLLADDFVISPLYPSALKPVHIDPLLAVYRADAKSLADARGDPGLEGWRTAVRRWREQRPTGQIERADFKTIGVELHGSQATTRVLWEVVGRQTAGAWQQNAQWRCVWRRVEPDQPPQLMALHVTAFDETRVPVRLFEDNTQAVLGNNPCYTAQLLWGTDQWRRRLDWRFGIDLLGPHGLAVGDVNGDGLDDLYVCEPGGLPNRLFLQRSDGTADEGAAAAGVDFLEPTHSALLLDLDNDGDQDLVLASGRYVLWLENDGAAHFVRRGIHVSNSVARSMTAADYDQDGDLDLYICGYFARQATAGNVGLGRPLPYHDANNGVANLLLANQGNWQFEDVTASVGLDENNRRFSYAAAWGDMDEDGDLDLYVANDFGRNNLYRQENGHFRDIAAEAGVEDISAGMSADWGDFNQDGRLDLYVGNMFSAAGNRVAYQRQFQPHAEQATRMLYQRHARGNSLFQNVGEGMFRDVSLQAGVTMGRWAWSCNFVDINNDGWQDLVVANGFVTSATDPGDL